MLLSVKIYGDRQVILMMENWPNAVKNALRAKVADLTNTLQQHVVNDKLHGQVLHQRSGRLVQSIQTRFEETDMKVKGHVYSAGTVKYAAFWEFGFTGVEQVSAHDRTANHVFGRAVAAYTQHVRAHTRKVDQAPRSFMRSALADLASGFEQELIATALGAMKGVA